MLITLYIVQRTWKGKPTEKTNNVIRHMNIFLSHIRDNHIEHKQIDSNNIEVFPTTKKHLQVLKRAKRECLDIINKDIPKYRRY